MKVAVYGTLKRGHGNNRILRGTSEFITEGVVRGFKLYDSNFPVAAHSQDTCVSVEVFDIGDPAEETPRRVLYNLDSLEGYREENPYRSMYLREPVTVHGDDGVSHEAYMYVGNEPFWSNFEGMRECPKDDNTNTYTWGR